MTGTVELDVLGNRIPSYEVTNDHKGHQIISSSFDPAKGDEMEMNKKYYYPGNTQQIPLDVPPCGFQNDKCSGTRFLVVSDNIHLNL